MSKESRQQPKSGSDVSASIETKTSAPVSGGTVRLRSLLDGGGEHPGTSSYVPRRGEVFEADAATGSALIAAGLAESVSKEGE